MGGVLVFSLDLKEESEEECPTERGREFKITGPMQWKERIEEKRYEESIWTDDYWDVPVCIASNPPT